MKLSPEIQTVLLNAEAKALATVVNNDVNVVPVSSVRIVEGKIWLIDYFFEKTRANIVQNPSVALTFWIGLRGYQIKANVNYLTKGETFKEAVNWISEIHPNRIVKGVLELDAKAVFDISINDKRI